MTEKGNYQDYLEAKRRVDTRCMNRHVFAEFKRNLRGRADMEDGAVVLDLGTGTGLMLRKIISLNPRGKTTLYGIDRNEENCAAARALIERELVESGYEIRSSGGSCAAKKGDARLTVTVIHGDFLDEPLPAVRDEACGFVTAHAVMDLVPLGKTIERVRALLEPGGVFYAPINYDGVTTLLPPYGNGVFENSLLALYNESMNRRSAGGEPTGGDRTGSGLYQELENRGFSILGFGPSDWLVFPRNGSYPSSDRRFLRYILHMIFKEGDRVKRKEGKRLRLWYERRLSDIESGKLTLLTHQTDIIARMK